MVIYPLEGILHLVSHTTLKELQFDLYEFELAGRKRAPQQYVAARNAATPSPAQEAAAGHRNWCRLQGVP